MRRTRRRDHRAESRVGDDVGPGHRRFIGAVKHYHVLSTVIGETSESIPQGHRRQADFTSRSLGRRDFVGHPQDKVRDQRLDRMRSIELSPKLAAIAAENRARHALEQNTFSEPHAICPEQVSASGPMLP